MSDKEQNHHKKKKKHSLGFNPFRDVYNIFYWIISSILSLILLFFNFFVGLFSRSLHIFDSPDFNNNDLYPTFKAINTKPSKAYIFLYAVLVIMLTCFLLWATFFEIDAYVHAKGEVETFSKINTINSPESNVIEKIHVVEGQIVKAGTLLITFDQATQQANSISIEMQYYANLANIARLEAQIDDKELVLSKEIEDFSKQLADEVRDRFKNEILTFKDGLNVNEQKIVQKNSEIKKIKEQIKTYEEKEKIILDELSTLEKLEAQQLVTKMRVIESRKGYSDNKISLDSFRADLPVAESALNELESAKSQFINSYKKQITADLAQARVLQNQLNAEFANVSKRLERSKVLSPIDGIVYKIPNTTTSSSIQPGQEIISLVPQEDSLIVNASVRPEDIGLIQLDQEASVKITAYDYAIYGLLKGKVQQISPETYVNPTDNKSYFHVKVKTYKNYLTHHDKKFYISPGMVANVDIMVDRRTVLQYITNPFIKTVRESLNEK